MIGADVELQERTDYMMGVPSSTRDLTDPSLLPQEQRWKEKAAADFLYRALLYYEL